MQTRLTHLLRFAALISVMGCDPKPADPQEQSSTSTSGGESTDGGTEDGTAEGTGEPQGCVPPSGDGFSCTADEDCAIAGDCCGCTAYNPNQGSPGNCGGACEMDKCEEWGVSEAACINGECVPSGLSCNQELVVCDALAPQCDDGFLPRVWGGCFTGDCLAIEACDWVPGCDSCAGNQACMHETRGGCEYERCVGPIPECQGQGPCECLGSIFCTGSCTPAADGFTCG